MVLDDLIAERLTWMRPEFPAWAESVLVNLPDYSRQRLHENLGSRAFFFERERKTPRPTAQIVGGVERLLHGFEDEAVIDSITFVERLDDEKPILSAYKVRSHELTEIYKNLIDNDIGLLEETAQVVQRYADVGLKLLQKATKEFIDVPMPRVPRMIGGQETYTHHPGGISFNNELYVQGVNMARAGHATREATGASLYASLLDVLNSPSGHSFIQGHEDQKTRADFIYRLNKRASRFGPNTIQSVVEDRSFIEDLFALYGSIPVEHDFDKEFHQDVSLSEPLGSWDHLSRTSPRTYVVDHALAQFSSNPQQGHDFVNLVNNHLELLTTSQGPGKYAIELALRVDDPNDALTRFKKMQPSISYGELIDVFDHTQDLDLTFGYNEALGNPQTAQKFDKLWGEVINEHNLGTFYTVISRVGAVSDDPVQAVRNVVGALDVKRYRQVALHVMDVHSQSDPGHYVQGGKAPFWKRFRA